MFNNSLTVGFGERAINRKFLLWPYDAQLPADISNSPFHFLSAVWHCGLTVKNLWKYRKTESKFHWGGVGFRRVKNYYKFSYLAALMVWSWWPAIRSFSGRQENLVKVTHDNRSGMNRSSYWTSSRHQQFQLQQVPTFSRTYWSFNRSAEFSDDDTHTSDCSLQFWLQGAVPRSHGKCF